MIRVKDCNELLITRGDTAIFAVKIVDEKTGEEYDIGLRDTLRFTVKRKVRDEEEIFQKKVVGSNIIRIETEDTEDMKMNRSYVYDVELTTENGEVCTVIKPSRFTVLEEVTW